MGKGGERMKQYCRYCAHCFEADDFRCSNHPKGKEPHWTESQIKHENHCPNFVLSDLGDVITGRQYKPKKRPAYDGQMCLDLKGDI